MSTLFIILCALLVFAIAFAPLLVVIWAVGLVLPGTRVLPKWLYK